MMKKELGSVVKVAVCMLFVLSLCLLPSCKKSEEPEPQNAEHPQNAENAEHPQGAEHPAGAEHPVTTTTPLPAAVTETKESTSTAAKPPAPKETEVAKAATAGLVAFEMELPKPMFVGTPQDTRVPNLEKPLGKPRPPFLAPPGTKNVALGKPVTSSDEEPIIGEIDYITDGDMEAADGSYVELGPFVQHVTIDLEAKHDIYAIVVWHYHKQARVYFDMVVQVADDPDFIENVVTVFNNDIDNSAGFGIGADKHYSETNEGKLIYVLDTGVKGRYVRSYSAGNTSNDLNHYIEIAVFGKPAN